MDMNKEKKRGRKRERKRKVSLTSIIFLSFLKRNGSIQHSKSLRAFNLINLSLGYLVLKMVLYQVLSDIYFHLIF